MKPPEGMKIEQLPIDETDRARNEVRYKVNIRRPGRWTVSPKRGDWIRRLRCTLTHHHWQTNARRTQRVCYHCWTVDELVTQP